MTPKQPNTFDELLGFDREFDAFKEVDHASKIFSFKIAEVCPESRELSIAMTKIEEAVMWAYKAVANQMKANPKTTSV